MGTGPNEGYKIVLYKEVMVGGNPQWQAVFTSYHALVYSDPQWQIYTYETTATFTPAGGTQYANALVEVWDVDNNYLIGSDDPVWVP